MATSHFFPLARQSLILTTSVVINTQFSHLLLLPWALFKHWKIPLLHTAISYGVFFIFIFGDGSWNWYKFLFILGMSTCSLKPLPGSPDLSFHLPEPIVQYFLIVKDVIETVSRFKHFFQDISYLYCFSFYFPLIFMTSHILGCKCKTIA